MMCLLPLLLAITLLAVAHPFVLVDVNDADLLLSDVITCHYELYASGLYPVQKTFNVSREQANDVFARPPQARGIERFAVKDVSRMDRMGHMVVGCDERGDYKEYLTHMGRHRSFNVSLVIAPVRLPRERVCLEVMIRQGLIDVFVPFRVETELNLTRHSAIGDIQTALGTPFIMPDRATIEMLSDKNNFATWMHTHGFGDYLPRSYRDLNSVAFPAVVKSSGGEFGIGTSIVHDAAQLRRAAAGIRPENLIIQEAVTGREDVSFYYVARKGRLLSAFCGLFFTDADVFVRGVSNAIPRMNTFKCTDLDAHSPFFDVMEAIVRDSGYNGFGCFDLKLVASHQNNTRVHFPIASLVKRLHRTSILSLSTDFAKRFPYQHSNVDPLVLPVVFELNTRVCANVATNSAIFNAMIRTYMSALSTEEARSS